jgi:hypothetical protein
LVGEWAGSRALPTPLSIAKDGAKAAIAAAHGRLDADVAATNLAALLDVKENSGRVQCRMMQ